MSNQITGNTSATPFKFNIGDRVMHLKNHNVYVIVGLPDEYVLEHDHSPAYAYRMPDGRICIRRQDEMEDGRFVPSNLKKSGVHQF